MHPLVSLKERGGCHASQKARSLSESRFIHPYRMVGQEKAGLRESFCDSGRQRHSGVTEGDFVKLSLP